jgi:hypothetical protein
MPKDTAMVPPLTPGMMLAMPMSMPFMVSIKNVMIVPLFFK